MSKSNFIALFEENRLDLTISLRELAYKLIQPPPAGSPGCRNTHTLDSVIGAAELSLYDLINLVNNGLRKVSDSELDRVASTNFFHEHGSDWNGQRVTEFELACEYTKDALKKARDGLQSSKSYTDAAHYVESCAVGWDLSNHTHRGAFQGLMGRDGPLK